jgi:hypothetical protein
MIVAIAALIMAMTGSAIAAKNYVLTDTGQIAPKVLKQLKGKRGPKGKQGAAGATGARGPAGVRGPAGDRGSTGPAGPVTTSLPAGETLRGWFNVDDVATEAEQFAGNGISFGMTLAAAPSYQVVPSGGPTTPQCAGSIANPTAAPGVLCVYESTSLNVKGFDLCGGSKCEGLDRFGAEMFVEANTTGRFFVDGTWAVTGN